MIVAGNTKDLIAAVHDTANAQVSTGTMYAVIRLESNDADDGKYWNGSAWVVLPSPFPTATHTEAGQWLYALSAGASTGKEGSSIHFSFTDNTTEASATTVCHGGEFLVYPSTPWADSDLLRYQGFVWLDTANGSAGTTVGTNGTPENPVDTLSGALSIAGAIGLRAITMVSGSLILTASLTEFLFVMRDESELNFGGQNVNGSEFRGGIVKGIMTGTITVIDSTIEDVSGFLGHAHSPGLQGTITLAVGTTTIHNGFSQTPGLTSPTIDFVGAGRSLNLRSYSGGIQLEGMINANNICTAEFIAGQLIVDSSCTLGTLAVRGTVKLTDNSAGTTINLSGTIPYLLWDALKSDHILADTFGELIQRHQAITGAAVNSPASSYVLTTGIQSSGTFSDTANADTIEHQHTSVGNALDLYYEFLIGGDGVPTSANLLGRLNSANDDLDVYAYNWLGVSWDKIGELNGKGGGSNDALTFTLLTTHVGTNTNLGKVRIRFFAASGLSSATLRIAQLIVAYAIASRTVGYVDGAVWIDTNVSNTSTELFVSGTADNPVSTLAAATTIADALGLKRFEITSRSMLTLTQAYVGYRFTGPFATIDLNGQDVDGAVFSGLIISGDDAGSNATPTHYNDCTLLGNTLGLHHLVHCIIEDAMIVSEPGDVHWFHCSSGIAGIGMPSFDFGASIADTAFSVRDYSGGLEIRNLGQAPTDTMSYEGVGQLQLAASCVGGTIAVRGNIELTDNSGDAVTLSDDARVTVSSIEAGASAANTITITVHDALAAIVPGITVDIYDSSNTALVRRATDDDDNGIVLVNLDDGTYKIRISGLGFQPDNNPETLVVTTDASVTYTGVQFSAPVAANPALCTVYGFATDASGNTKDGETISFLGEGPIGVSGNQITAHRIDVVTGPTATNPAWASGYFEIDLIRLSTVRLKSPKLQFDNLVITVPDLATQQLTVLTEAAK